MAWECGGGGAGIARVGHTERMAPLCCPHASFRDRFGLQNVLFARLHACAVVLVEPILVPDCSTCGVIEAASPPGPIVSMYKQTVSAEIPGVE